ncbi:MAG: murein L,D-transpeptidase catalytic domain family protein [Bacteriovoracaceae bacterium]|nr:murein L,D-transpeptidase catalytic domain family protein [Bacteriovoracaceae bacterium]
MKSIFITVFLMLSMSNAYANRSVDVWQNYFPNMNCNKNACAKNVSAAALEEFLEKASYFRPGKLKSTTWAFLVDFTLHSKHKRGWLINLKTGKAEAMHVSHGKGSGNGSGRAVRFSNTNDSKMSSLGLYLTAETYYGSNGYSLRLDGLESSNSAARPRAIVMHGADYMSSSFIRNNGRSGRSWGCPAIAQSLKKRVINSLKGGSLFYHYHN